jgi:uncharacterized integral membrane protein
MEYSIKALHIYEKVTKETIGLAMTLSNIASIYVKYGKIPSALDYYQRSFKIY